VTCGVVRLAGISLVSSVTCTDAQDLGRVGHTGNAVACRGACAAIALRMAGLRAAGPRIPLDTRTDSTDELGVSLTVHTVPGRWSVTANTDRIAGPDKR
jgi:hypothetical protein